MSRYDNQTMRSSYLFNSGVGNMQRSMINTSMMGSDQAGDQFLKGSKIRDLPGGTKKKNLGESSNFVIVFQTIEIERLSTEVEVLRVKIKEQERQLLNSMNYEVQIRELTEKCFSQQRQIGDYRQQYEKLNKICQTLYHENEMLKAKVNEMDFSLKQKYESQKNKNAELQQQLERWRSRHQASQKSKVKEIQDLKEMMESQRKSMIDRQIRQMTIRFQNQRSGLENEIRKLREMLDNRQRQIQDYKTRIQKSQILIMQLRNNQSIIEDYENKLSLLNSQLIRLNEILKDKQQQLNSFRQKEFKLNQQIKEQKQWQYENKQLNNALDSKNREIQDWKIRASRLQEEVTRAREMEFYNEELGNKLNLASRELQRLNGVLKNKLQEIDSWKKRYSDKQAEYSKYRNLQNQMGNYETKIDNLKIENERINSILKSRLGEIQEWRNRYNNIQRTISQYEILEKDKRSLEEKYNNQIATNEQLKFLISKLENEINVFRRNENQFKEIERNNGQLVKEVERLNNMLKNQGNELNDFKVRYDKVQNTISEYKQVEVKLRDYENKINLLTNQLDKLNDLLKDRNREISQLESQKLELISQRNHYKDYKNKLNEQEQSIGRMQDLNNNLKRDIDSWQNKYREADGNARQKQNQLFKFSQQKQKLNTMVKSKNNEYDELRNEYNRLQPQVRRSRQLEVAIQEQQNQIMGLMQDKEGYERKLKGCEQELERQKGYTNEFAFKIIVLSCEIQRLSQEGGMSSKAKAKEMMEMQESYSTIQRKVNAKNQEIEMLITKITSLENALGNMNNEFARILRQVQRSQLETRKLVKQIEQYQNYAKKITILGNEIDRLTSQNHKLDEDARHIRLKYAGEMASENREELKNIHFVLMAVEIESLRDKLKDMQQDANSLRKSVIDPARKLHDKY